MTRSRPTVVRIVAVFLVFLVFVCAVRAPSFFWSVINWDESIYLVISSSMLEGHVLYTDIWDRKQPLTFGFFALSQLIFGKTILAIRLLACIAVSITCLLLFRIGRATFGDDRLGAVVAAGLYAVFTVSSGGLATNTEILFAPFAVAAVGLILPWWVHPDTTDPPSAWCCFVAGVLLGLGTFTKLIVVYEVGAVVLLLAAGWTFSSSSGDLHLPFNWIIGRLGTVAAGISIPWIAGVTYFSLAGALDEFIFSNFTFNLMNMADRPPLSLHSMWLVAQREVLGESGLLWLGFVIGVGLLVTNPASLTRGHRRLLVALIGWVVIATAAAVSLRYIYLHYYLQAFPPLALLGGFVFAWIWRRFVRVPVLLRVAIAATLLVPQSLRISERWRHVAEVVDVPAAVAEYVAERVQPGEYIYVANYQPIIYFITKTQSPTRWAFPQFLISPEFRSRLGIQLREEMASIFGHQPTYVIVQTREGSLLDPAYYRLLFTEYLDADYELEGTISTIALYRRKDPTDRLGDPASSKIGSIED
jgi:4-amino-4-deoxy-L-arabinose transferase-like glycosyltransferase